MRTKTGIVSSAKMNKTIVVRVDSHRTHPKYHKSFSVNSKFYAHDELKSAKEGDTVVIQECRPLSRLKRWVLIEVNGKSIELSIPPVL